MKKTHKHIYTYTHIHTYIYIYRNMTSPTPEEQDEQDIVMREAMHSHFHIKTEQQIIGMHIYIYVCMY